ncbi:MAG: molybdenum cofactor guanylyltransferase [Chthoniobacterales bacterium]|nr:molybdenum cofactor guanylyltransferase [Chthoniobacterales bacterium]
MRCSAVLLAGGKSTRMGRDKAFLDYHGEPLWQRQLATLRALSPEQLMISGPRRAEWSDCEVVPDEVSNAGPLAGVTAALQKCSAPLLVVLAVDLPRVTAEFLRSLLALGGAVAQGPHGFEPLAAVYPTSCAALAAQGLSSGDFSMQNFVREANGQGLLVACAISGPDLFTNLNSPSDL